MKKLFACVLPAILLSVPGWALADHDDDDDDHRHRHHHHHRIKKQYWEGNCKVTVIAKKHGGYEEIRDCKRPPPPPPRVVVQPQPVYVQPKPVYIPAPPPPEPGVSIQGTVRLP